MRISPSRHPVQRVDLVRANESISQRKATQLLEQISQLKRRNVPPAISGVAPSPVVICPDLAAAKDRYDRAMATRQWVDFDDLIVLPVRVLDDHRELVQQYHTRYRWVCIDEYQDIDAWQYRLIRHLVAADGNLCAIGDPDQAIYSFRGADVSFFQRFEQDFPSARRVSLTKNYRSTRPIVDASSQMILPATLLEDRSDQQATNDTDSPNLVAIHQCTTERAEAEFVVHSIERLIGGSSFFSLDSGRVDSHEGEALSFGDFAVLYRTDAVSGPLVEALGRSGMPYQKRVHTPLADHPLVEQLLPFLTDQPVDEDPIAGATLTVADRLHAAIARMDEPVAEAQADPTVASLHQIARHHGDDFQGFVNELTLGADVDLWDPRADRVSLLSLHAAKGLEFPVVFIVGCEDGIIPLKWGAADDADLAEERRIFFVGMTRAKNRLVLTHAGKRRWRGKVGLRSPSPYLRDIEQQLLETHHHRATRKRPANDDQPTLFT